MSIEHCHCSLVSILYVHACTQLKVLRTKMHSSIGRAGHQWNMPVESYFISVCSKARASASRVTGTVLGLQSSGRLHCAIRLNSSVQSKRARQGEQQNVCVRAIGVGVSTEGTLALDHYMSFCSSYGVVGVLSRRTNGCWSLSLAKGIKKLSVMTRKCTNRRPKASSVQKLSKNREAAVL